METTVEAQIEWDPRLRQYTMAVIIDGENEELVFSTLKEAFDARVQYLAGLL